ncbi:MAG: tetratricopeptide repeat protein, partial [Terriglobales bacterium]
EAPAEAPALGETDYPVRFGWAPLRSIRAGDRKLIEAPRPEFYDLLQDPGEMQNRYEPWNQKVQELRALLATASARAATPPGTSGQVSEKTLEHLRALGYLGSDPGQSNVPEPSLLPDPKDKIELQNLVHRAMMADEDGRQDVARRELLKAVAADGSLAVAFVQLGQIELSQGSFAEASTHLAQARRLRPQDSAAAWYHGQALHKLGNLAAARDALEQSLRLTPGQYDARLLLGKIYVSLQDAPSAEDQFEAAAFLKPQRVEARRELARLYLDGKRFSEAAAQLEKAVAAGAESAELFELLGRAYSGLGRAEAARRAAGRAAALRQKEKAP